MLVIRRRVIPPAGAHCENFVYEIVAIVENRVTRSNRNTILHGIIKQKQLYKHQIYIMNDDQSPSTSHRRPLLRYVLYISFFFFAKSWNFCDINRRPTRPDNFITGVKMFPYARVARRECVAIGSVIFARRVLQFTRHFAARNIPYTNEEILLRYIVYV